MANDDLTTRAEAEAALFGGDILFAPIRHHSPACAWAVREMIRAHEPDIVLIEAPSDLVRHTEHFGEPDLHLPVAIAALGPEPDEGRPRPVTYYPLSEHSPEWAAMAEARAIGAEIRFIDMPVSHRMIGPDAPQNLQSERAFDSADFIRATCKTLRLRDGSELWDHLFEARLGTPDWRGFFADVYAYCLALRESTAPEVMEADRTLAREDIMRAHLAEVSGRAVCVTGGFHTPALVAGAQAQNASRPKPVETESYLIGYGEEALDALSGYGAGLRYPGWYAAAWRAAMAADGPPDWQALALETTAGFAGAMAGDERRVPLPQLVEMAAVAEGLARMRGRDAVLLADLFDGMRTALIKEQAGPGEPYTERMHAYLRGTALGKAPHAAGNPPIVDDARERAGRARIDMTSSERKPKKLDIRRKDSHRAASRFLHQMSLIEAGLGEVETGPDFLTGHRVDLLFEEWTVGWTPFVEGRLIEAARYGPTVPGAAAAILSDRIDRLTDDGSAPALGDWLYLVLVGLRAGLATALPGLVGRFADQVAASADFDGLASVILKLSAVSRPGDPLHDPNGPDLFGLSVLAFDRILYLAADLPQTPDEALPARIGALRIVAGVLHGPSEGRFDRDRFDRTLESLLDAPDCPPILGGAVMGLLVNAGLREPGALAALLSGTLLGVGAEAEDRVGALRGMLMTAPSLLWLHRSILTAADAALEALGDDGFVDILPDLRREMTQLNPHETDRLAEELADHLGLSGGSLTAQSGFAEADMARALKLDADLARILTADGVLSDA